MYRTPRIEVSELRASVVTRLYIGGTLVYIPYVALSRQMPHVSSQVSDACGSATLVFCKIFIDTRLYISRSVLIITRGGRLASLCDRTPVLFSDQLLPSPSARSSRGAAFGPEKARCFVPDRFRIEFEVLGVRSIRFDRILSKLTNSLSRKSRLQRTVRAIWTNGGCQLK